MPTTRTLTGYDAINYAEANRLSLSKYNDPVEDARKDLTPDEARKVAREDSNLIYVATGGAYTYTVRTDAVLQDVTATTIDEAAAKFASGEFPTANITGVEELFAHVQEIGDGAWCWIESDDAPDGQRQSIGEWN